MGAWGSGNLENDTALDFLADYQEGGAQTIIDAFGAVEQSGGYLDLDVSTAALAAAEIVATGFGRPVAGLDPETEAEMLTHQEAVRQLDGVVPRARQAVSATANDTSELRELWTDAGSEEEWLGVVTDLQGRLEAVR